MGLHSLLFLVLLLWFLPQATTTFCDEGTACLYDTFIDFGSSILSITTISSLLNPASWLLATAVLCIFALIAGCGKMKPKATTDLGDGGSTQGTTNVSSKDKQTSSTEKPAPSLATNSKRTAGYMDFALALFRAASTHTENFVFSPFALGASLAMMMDGAKGKTQHELAKMLGPTLSPSATSSFFSNLASSLTKTTSGVVTRLVNGFFVDKEFTLKPEYERRVKKSFGASVKKIDFKDGDGSAEHVNKFVKKNTGGMIPQLVSADVFAHGHAQLTSAICFEGEWAEKFITDATRKGTFFGTNDDRKIRYMVDKRRALYSLSEDLVVVSLRYKDPTFSLVVIMPTANFGEWRENLSTDKLHAAISNLRMDMIDLEVPKFKITSTTDGKATLQKLGVRAIFDDKADLSGICKEPLAISMMVHSAVIQVTEEGTMAGATTATFIDHLCDCPELSFNKPFLYALMKDDCIIFLGQFV